MATRNKYIEDEIITREEARQWCTLTTKKICEVMGWTYTDSVNDNGIDAIDENGKRYQIKAYFENSPTITFDFDFNKNQNIHKNAHYIFKQALKKYCNKFDALVIYTGKLRGEPFDINNIAIYDGKDASYDYIVKHGHRAYMKYANSSTGKAQVHLRKTACGDIEKIEIK
jgi:hypothetical protein